MSPHRQREALVRALVSGPVLRTGLLTGCLLVVVMVASLLVANHVPRLESVARLRNDICRLAFGLVVLIPIFRFLFQPRRLFSSALVGWVIFTISYGIAGAWFVNLFTSLRRTPLEVFLLGMITYGVVSVFSWVALLILAASRRPVPHSSHIARDAHQSR
ncbi:MAG TPA: hypothetical protein VGT03_06420 [Candidatus Acidoferrales bacterium]|nr:hypothetical protein [Candidatus Acidoferrales bacterium]